MKASDLLIKALENEGVQHIFSVPGEETLDLMESIRKSKIQFIVLRHEQIAGFMAATYGRLTGKPGVCLVTLGPGVTNLMTAVAHAQLGGMAMVVISGQKAIKEHKQGKFQIIDAISMMRPLTKSAKTILNAHNIPALVRESFHLAQEETPGVVHLELPEDIAQTTSEGIAPFPLTPLYKPYPNKKAIEEAIKMIENAKYPLLMLGVGAKKVNITEAVNAFLKKIPIPFFSTQMGKGVLDESHSLCLGTAALSEGDFLHCAIRHADLIINIGHDIIEKPPFFMSPQGAKVIHINPHPAEIDDTYFPQLEVIGDITHTLEALTQKVHLRANYNLSYYTKIKEKAEIYKQKGIADSHFPISPPKLVDEIQKVMPKDGILALDNGMYKIWFARNYCAHQPDAILLDNALATMGAGIGVAMGAKMVYPDRKVVAICGDGGFLMNSNALESAIRLKLDLVIIVLRDNGYGMIKWKQEIMKFPSFGLDFDNPDFVKYAEAYGAFGIRITSTEMLAPTLAKCLITSGVHLIEVPIDYSKNTYMLGSQLAEYSCNL